MSSREPLHPDDPDDWFGGSDAPPSARVDDDWLEDEPRATWQRPEINRGTAILVGVAVLVLIIAGLAIGGVFSSGKKHTPPPTIPATTTRPQSPHKAQPQPVAAPATTLKPGDTGVQVKRLQRALKKLGYPVGKIDGDYGAATETALKKFQTDKKLTADGVLGPKTLAALKTALTAAR